MKLPSRCADLCAPVSSCAPLLLSPTVPESEISQILLRICNQTGSADWISICICRLRQTTEASTRHLLRLWHFFICSRAWIATPQLYGRGVAWTWRGRRGSLQQRRRRLSRKRPPVT
jgi:hypothetical protein